MITHALVLAGGLGTRISSVAKHLPKPMLPVNGKPFLAYVLDFLNEQKIKTVTLSVGHKSEVIQDYFKDAYNDLKITYSVEDEPLGTGGGILKAVKGIDTENVFVLNGDTLFKIDLKELWEFHKTNNSKLTLALKQMSNFDRYGIVETNAKGKITGFKEKQFRSEGMINGGIYVLDCKTFKEIDFPEKFSFEKDFMEKYSPQISFFGKPFDGYFIDIGIPEDYEKAQRELK